VCWRLAALAPGETINLTDLDGALVHAPLQADASDAGWEAGLAAWARAQLAAGSHDLHAQARDRLDRILLGAALAHTQGHRSEAAARLGLGRNTLTRKLATGRKGQPSQ
jgi:two-component system nitrogen regulation response regulator GlnG